MPNLIPEKRVDRNGRAVTRHVLAPGTASEPLKQFPAVKPLTDLTKQVAEFQKLSFLMGAGTADDLNRLYPVAGTIARASELCNKEVIRDLYRTALYENEPEWSKSFATTCHFIVEAGGAKDAESVHTAVTYAAEHYSANDLLQADSSTQQKVVDLVAALNNSRFIDGVVGHSGSQPVDIKKHEFLNYLCSRIDDGTLQDAMPAIKDLDEFINFWEDEQEDETIVQNLDYTELVSLMEYARKHTSASPELVLGMVRSHNFKAGEVLGRIDSYEGFSALIDGNL
jgi:hypothetical protein